MLVKTILGIFSMTLFLVNNPAKNPLLLARPFSSEILIYVSKVNFGGSYISNKLLLGRDVGMVVSYLVLRRRSRFNWYLQTAKNTLIKKDEKKKNFWKAYLGR